MSASDEYKNLRVWIKNQNDHYRNFVLKKKYSAMSEMKIKMLNDIGFKFKFENFLESVGPEKTKESVMAAEQAGAERARKVWTAMYNCLKTYKEEYGSCNVTVDPKDPKKNEELLRWVKRQNMQYEYLKSNKESKMKPERLKMLQDIGFHFDWDHKKVGSILNPATQVQRDGRVVGVDSKNADWERRRWEELVMDTSGLTEDRQAANPLLGVAAIPTPESQTINAPKKKNPPIMVAIIHFTTPFLSIR